MNIAPSIVANYLSRNQQTPEVKVEKKTIKPGCGAEGCEGGFIQDKPGRDVYSMCKNCHGKGVKFNK